jgi:predicted RNA-binding protein with TRAM domain
VTSPNYSSSCQSYAGSKENGTKKAIAVHDILEVKIIETSRGNFGIVRIANFFVFVPNCKKDETVKVKIVKTCSRFAIGRRIDGIP